MANILNGTLSQMNLSEILKLLISGSKTGRLELSKDEKKGDIYLKDGAILYAKWNNKSGVDALYELMTWMNGDFNFVPDASINNLTGDMFDMGIQNIDEWSRVISEEWSSIRKIIPTTDVVFKITANKTPKEVNLKAEEWKVLANINGAKSVEEIAQCIGLSEFDTSRIICRLCKEGLIEETEKPKPMSNEIVNGNFFPLLEEALTKFMGPMASIIVDEKTKMLKYERNAFPKSKLAKLIEHISNEISDESKRVSFQQSMLGVIKNI
ncbi:MAG: DUF4388 domain-containing protein [Nitrospirae bacterium]|nr:DUF4388 domain-containing protein [Nitrospirota bacterium]